MQVGQKNKFGGLREWVIVCIGIGPTGDWTYFKQAIKNVAEAKFAGTNAAEDMFA